MDKRPASTLDASQIKTAAFVIEEEILRHNLSILKYVHDKTGATMLHALKAWATWQFLPMEREYLQGTEVSSLNEARLGYEEFGPEVHMFAPAYQDHEFEEIMKYCSTIIFNSFAQWQKFKSRIEEFHAKSGKTIECGLRINPEYSGESEHGDLWSPTAPGSRLGIRISEFKAALANDPKALEGIDGLHLHIFFEKDLADFKAALPVIEEKFGEYFKGLKWVNFGGGLKFTDDNADVEGYIAAINEFQEKHNVHTHFEPGAAIAWYAGSLVSSVLDIVERDDVPYKIPILDISFEDHLTDFFVSSDLDLEVRGATIERDDTKLAGKNAYKFGGMTCIAGDKMAYAHIFPAPLNVGDKVVIDHAIQYTLIKITMFNGVQHPAIVSWKDGKATTLREFSYQDYKSRMG
jgi:carboxynorspermidine decarboxylase